MEIEREGKPLVNKMKIERGSLGTKRVAFRLVGSKKISNKIKMNKLNLLKKKLNLRLKTLPYYLTPRSGVEGEQDRRKYRSLKLMYDFVKNRLKD